MRLAPIVARLLSQCPNVRQVMSALSAAVPTSYPAAYVLPISERAMPSEWTGTHRQRVEARFGVEIMVRHVAQAVTGGPAQDELEDARASIIDALVGWAPGAEFEPIDFAGGGLVAFEAGRAVWRDEFTTAYLKEMK